MQDISIIMPVYNASMFLEETVNSILMQTYSNFELICINDASMDNTIEILREFQKKDERIQIIENEKRLGAAGSRNKGIDVAQGRYITFLDGDDIFEEEMLELAYNKIEETNADIVVYEYMHVDSKKIYEKRHIYHTDNFKKQFTEQTFSIQDFDPIAYTKWSASPCNKLYRLRTIKENKLKFQSLSSANDVYFVEMVLLLSSRIIALDSEKVMVYARDHNTSTRISFNRDPRCVYYAMKEVGNALIERDCFEALGEYYYLKTFYYLCGAILKTKGEEDKRLFYEFLHNEGVKELISINRKTYEKCDNDIHELFQKFITLEFDTKWFLYENTLTYYLYKKSDRIKNLFIYYKNKKRILWGAGEYGKVFLKFINDNCLTISAVVDISIKKQGTSIEGYIVENPLNSVDDDSVVFTTSYSVSREVEKVLNNKKVLLIDIGQLLGKD